MNIEAYDIDSLRKLVRSLQNENTALKSQLQKANIPYGEISHFEERIEKVEILERGKVPFYCCAWSNIKSARNAIKSGFKPAWAQMTVKPLDMINEMNGIK